MTKVTGLVFLVTLFFGARTALGSGSTCKNQLAGSTNLSEVGKRKITFTGNYLRYFFPFLISHGPPGRDVKEAREFGSEFATSTKWRNVRFGQLENGLTGQALDLITKKYGDG